MILSCPLQNATSVEVNFKICFHFTSDTFQMLIWTYNSTYHVGWKGKTQAEKSRESNHPLKQSVFYPMQ